MMAWRTPGLVSAMKTALWTLYVKGSLNTCRDEFTPDESLDEQVKNDVFNATKHVNICGLKSNQ